MLPSINFATNRVPEENTDFYSNKVITMATISEGGWVCQTQFLEDHPKTLLTKDKLVNSTFTSEKFR
jgi:hypothetical protein